MDTELKRVAWNGIACEVPADFDPLALGRAEIRLGPPGEAILSLKWRPINGRFSPKKHFARVKRAFSGDGEATQEDWTEGFAPSDGRTILPYVWRTTSEAGLGAVLHDSSARAGALFQARTDDREAALAWLDSLCLIPRDQPLSFDLFDITATIPAGFFLESFFFKPGHFGLTFARKRAQLVLERLGPADVILEVTELADLGMIRWPDLTKAVTPQEFEAGDGPGVNWSKAPASLAGRLISRLFRRRAHQCLRIWREMSANRILAVAMRDSGPLNQDMIEAICRDYATVRP